MPKFTMSDPEAAYLLVKNEKGEVLGSLTEIDTDKSTAIQAKLVNGPFSVSISEEAPDWAKQAFANRMATGV